VTGSILSEQVHQAVSARSIGDLEAKADNATAAAELALVLLSRASTPLVSMGAREPECSRINVAYEGRQGQATRSC
jgi:hypothetical protein